MTEEAVTMKLLMIGNSHTYYNDMPKILWCLLELARERPHITMLTAGGKDLRYHVADRDVSFNIRCGDYDMVIAQDRASGFDADGFAEGAAALKQMADAAGSRFFLYMPWAGREQRQLQRPMTEAYHAFCRANGCLFAPAGEVFSRLLLTEPAELLYHEDGNHATPFGSYVAALTVFYTVTGRKRVMQVTEIDDPGVKAGFFPELCQRAHAEACRMARLYNG